MNTDKTELNPARKPWQTSAETVALRRRMETMNVGDVITYAEVERIIGCDHRQSGSPATVIRQLRRDKQMVFSCVRNTGYQRLNDKEASESADLSTAKIRRISKRSLEVLATVDPAKLTREDQNKHFMRSATHGALAFMTQRKQQGKLLAASNGAKPLEIGDTMRLFGGQ